MNQFYFLSVFCNLFAGLFLVQDRLSPRREAARALQALAASKSLILSLGLLSALTGAMKLVSVSRGDYEVYGDLLPALAGIIASIALFFSIAGWTPAGGFGRVLNALFTRHRFPLGIACLAAAALHFLFPSVSIL